MRKEKVLVERLEWLVGTIFSFDENSVKVKVNSKMSKAQKRALLQHRLKRLRDVLEAFGGWDWVVSAEKEKQAYREIIEYRNRLLQEKAVGKVYYSLTYSKAGRREKIRLLRQVWSKQSYRLARLRHPPS